MQDVGKESAKLIISQFKTIAATLCDSEMRIVSKIDESNLMIDVFCSAEDTAVMIGKGGKTKFAISQLLESKARKLKMVQRVILWVREKVDVASVIEIPEPAQAIQNK